jgi:nicotinate-nucleotide adenylyltransferase
MKVGVFGGTFDPPHLGHLIAAQEIHLQLGLDELLLVPAAVPPHKRDRAFSPAPIRLEMLTAAVAGDPRFRVSDLEIRRDGPSYTVDTLRELRSDRPDARLYLAMGADQVAELESWREPDAIVELAELVAFAREGQAVPSVPWPVTRVRVPTVEISSTEIRRRAGAGEPITYWIPPQVEAIARRERLYGLEETPLDG